MHINMVFIYTNAIFMRHIGEYRTVPFRTGNLQRNFLTTQRNLTVFPLSPCCSLTHPCLSFLLLVGERYNENHKYIKLNLSYLLYFIIGIFIAAE